MLRALALGYVQILEGQEQIQKVSQNCLEPRIPSLLLSYSFIIYLFIYLFIWKLSAKEAITKTTGCVSEGTIFVSLQTEV